MNRISDTWRRIARYLINVPRRSKSAIVMVADAIVLGVTMYVTLAVLTRSWPTPLDDNGYLVFLAPAVTIPLLNVFGVYDAVVRFVNGDHIQRSIPSVVLACLILAAAAWAGGTLGAIWNVLAVYGLAAVAGLSIERSAASLLLRDKRRVEGLENVVIYGAGDAGRQLAAALTQTRRFKVCGFVDDKPELQLRTMLGFPIYSLALLPEVIKTRAIRRVLLAIPSASQARRREVLESLEQLQVQVMVMPFLDEIASGQKRVDQLREVEIGDLLGRDPVAPMDALLDMHLKGRSVLVTGAGGSIGSELCRQAIGRGARKLALFERNEFALYALERELAPRALAIQCELVPILGSVTDSGYLRHALAQHGVETVYHVAAYKHVPLVEQNALAAVANNALGTLDAFQAAIAARVSNFVLVSTDKAVNPANIMGASKRACEMAVQALSAAHPEIRASIVRFGNVLDSSGSVVPLFRQQIRDGGPVTVTHRETTRYFMTIPEAAQLVIQAGAMGGRGDIFVLDMGQPVRILDLAERMIRLSGRDVRGPEAPNGIEISFIGLRPGEKLHEELLVDGNPMGTGHPRIFRGDDAFVPWEVAQTYFRQMESAVRANDTRQLLDVLNRFVSTRGPAALGALQAPPQPAIELVGGTAV